MFEEFLLPATILGTGFVALIILAIVLSGVKKVNQYEKGVIERFGAYEKKIGAGLTYVIPFVQRIHRVNMREQVIDVPPQEIITEDNVVVTIDAIVYYQIMDAFKALYEIEDFELAIVKLAQTTLRNIVGEMSLDTCLTSREKINDDLRKILDEATDKWGTKVNRIEVQRIDPPQDIQTAMHKQKTSEQNRRSMKLEATGEKEAANQKRMGMIFTARGERKATILKAEGQAEAIKKVADAQAEAVRLVSEAANKYFKEPAQLLKRLTILPETFGHQSKLIVPSDADVLALAGFGTEGGLIPLKLKPSNPENTETEHEH